MLYNWILFTDKGHELQARASIGGNDGGGDDGGNNGGLNVESVNGKLVVHFAYDSSSGSSSNCVADIKNKVKDTCLHRMVQAAMDRDIEYQLGVSMKSIFGAGSKFNLTFLDAPIANVSGKIVDAQTDVVGTPKYYLKDGTRPIYGSMDLNITLNSNSLPGTTEEYITVSILHEALHAYFRQTGQIDDHNEMVNNYIPWFESAMHVIYPNMPPADLEALAYGGLMDSMAFSMTEKDAFALLYNQTNKLYINGTKGQKCH